MQIALSRYGSCGLALLAFLCVAHGTVRRVPQEYATIQAALNAVVVNDTVLVSLGTYAEELQAPPVRFWLLGDVAVDTGDFARPVIDPSSLDSAQWRRCMNVPAGSQPTVERMGFVNRAPMYPRPEVFLVAGIEITSEDTATFRHCRFDSVYRAISEHPFADTTVHFVVEDCRFLNAPRIQIRTSFDGSAKIIRCYFQGRRCTSELTLTGSNSDIEQCVFTADSLYSAVNLSHSQESARLRNCIFGPIDTCAREVFRLDSWQQALIEGNVFCDIGLLDRDLGYLTHSGGEPIQLRHNTLINIFALQDGNCSLLSVHRPAEAPPGFSVIIDSNLFANSVSPPGNHQGKALALWTQSSATGNHFVNLAPESIATVSILPGLYGGFGSEFRYNQFEAGDYGIASYAGGAPDAILNWWGDVSGPYNAIHNPEGLGARVDDAILFDPWSPDTNFLSVPGIGKPLPVEFVFEAYPNPFNSTVHLTLIPSEVQIVKLELFDLLGRKVQEIWNGPLAFQKDLTFDASSLSCGIYFARVTDTINRRPLAITKLVLLK